MSTLAKTEPVLTAEQYLKDELARPEKYEFVNGMIYAMGGASAHHGLISINLGSSLHNRLPDTCQVFIADMKVQIQTKDTECYYYPDILVSGNTDEEKDDYFRNAAKIIIEVLSPSTQRIDRTEKLENYKLIPSVEEILLVAQDVPRLEIYRRKNTWQKEIFYSEDSFTLESVGLGFEMMDVYKKCSFM